MSISALLKGVEIRLRSAAVLNDQPSETVGKLCGVQPDGSPPANAGQMYYAVWFAGIRNADPNALSLDWYYSVGVTITAKMAYAPKDRRGARVAASSQLLDQAVVVATALHQDDLHRIRANELITGSEDWAAAQVPPVSPTTNGFVEPLRLQSIGNVRDAPPGWAGTDGKNEMLYVEVKFQEARRILLLS